jgi:hypothetical protein
MDTVAYCQKMPKKICFGPSGNGNYIGTGKQVQNKKPSIATFPDYNQTIVIFPTYLIYCSYLPLKIHFIVYLQDLFVNVS